MPPRSWKAFQRAEGVTGVLNVGGGPGVMLVLAPKGGSGGGVTGLVDVYFERDLHAGNNVLLGAQFADETDSIHVAKLQVHNHDVRTLCTGGTQPTHRGFRDHDPETVGLKQRPQFTLGVRIALYDEHSVHCRRHSAWDSNLQVIQPIPLKIEGLRAYFLKIPDQPSPRLRRTGH